jgi:hypothetical protein
MQSADDKNAELDLAARLAALERVVRAMHEAAPLGAMIPSLREELLPGEAFQPFRRLLPVINRVYNYNPDGSILDVVDPMPGAQAGLVAQGDRGSILYSILHITMTGDIAPQGLLPVVDRISNYRTPRGSEPEVVVPEPGAQAAILAQGDGGEVEYAIIHVQMTMTRDDPPKGPIPVIIAYTEYRTYQGGQGGLIMVHRNPKPGAQAGLVAQGDRGSIASAALRCTMTESIHTSDIAGKMAAREQSLIPQYMQSIAEIGPSAFPASWTIGRQ